MAQETVQRKNEIGPQEPIAKMKDFAQNINENASQMADQVSDSYRQSTSWLSQNYPKALAVVGIVAAAGVVGYLLSRRLTDEDWEMDRKAS